MLVNGRRMSVFRWSKASSSCSSTINGTWSILGSIFFPKDLLASTSYHDDDDDDDDDHHHHHHHHHQPDQTKAMRSLGYVNFLRNLNFRRSRFFCRGLFLSLGTLVPSVHFFGSSSSQADQHNLSFSTPGFSTWVYSFKLG